MTTEMNSDLGDETSNMLQTKNLSLTSSNSEPAYNGIPSISIICRIKPSKVPDKDEIRVSKPKHSKSTSRGLTNQAFSFGYQSSDSTQGNETSRTTSRIRNTTAHSSQMRTTRNTPRGGNTTSRSGILRNSRSQSHDSQESNDRHEEIKTQWTIPSNPRRQRITLKRSSSV